MTENLTLIFSLISLGFFGGFTHCAGMCGPFVITQVTNRLQQTSLQNFSEIARLKNLALLPYHVGRITTYALLGFFSSFFAQNIQDFFGFKIFSAIFLLLAALTFLGLFFDKKSFAEVVLFKKIKLRFKSLILENALHFFSKKISDLFKEPQGLNGYFLGVILGFIPCGLLYSAFLICGAIHNPVLAAIGMILFGLGTFPSLFFTAVGGGVFNKIPEFKFIAKGLILLNAIMLLLMAVKLILSA